MEDALSALKGRLWNWKFGSAMAIKNVRIKRSSRRTIKILARMFGNCGWISGDMAELISCTVECIFHDEGWKLPDNEP